MTEKYKAFRLKPDALYRSRLQLKHQVTKKRNKALGRQHMYRARTYYRSCVRRPTQPSFVYTTRPFQKTEDLLHILKAILWPDFLKNPSNPKYRLSKPHHQSEGFVEKYYDYPWQAKLKGPSGLGDAAKNLLDPATAKPLFSENLLSAVIAMGPSFMAGVVFGGIVVYLMFKLLRPRLT